MIWPCRTHLASQLTTGPMGSLVGRSFRAVALLIAYLIHSHPPAPSYKTTWHMALPQGAREHRLASNAWSYALHSGGKTGHSSCSAQHRTHASIRGPPVVGWPAARSQLSTCTTLHVHVPGTTITTGPQLTSPRSTPQCWRCKCQCTPQ